MARYLPIALASLVLSASFAFPALAERGSGRANPPTPDLTKEGGSRCPLSHWRDCSLVKPDRPSLTKEYDDNAVLSCTIWLSYDGQPAANYAPFEGTRIELATTLSQLRLSDRNAVWGCS